MRVDKTLTRPFCSLKCMHVVVPDDVPALSVFSMFQKAGVPGLPKGVTAESILQAQGDPVKTLEFDNTQLDMNMEIDFDEETTFKVTVWNLPAENTIKVGDQLVLKIWWKGYDSEADALVVSGMTTSVVRKRVDSDYEFTIKGDIVADWALTYLKPTPTPTVLFTFSQLLRLIANAGIKEIRAPMEILPMPLLIKDESIREVLNLVLDSLGTTYTWSIMNDIIFFYLKGTCISESIDVIDLNTSDVIEYEIEDNRIHLTTYGLPELDDGSIFKYDGSLYFVDTIKHTLHYKTGYLCDIYAEVKANDTA